MGDVIAGVNYEVNVGTMWITVGLWKTLFPQQRVPPAQNLPFTLI